MRRRALRRRARDARPPAATGLDQKVEESNLFLEQPVRQTSTVLAIRYAYDLLTDFCPTCPRRDSDARPVYYEI